MTEHGKILRVDYRRFVFNVYIDMLQMARHHTQQGKLLTRINNYFDSRPDCRIHIEQNDIDCTIQFETLDDAKMFVLAFSDVIYTDGVKFD